MNVTIMTDASFDDRCSVGGYGYWIASPRGKLPGGGEIIEVDNVITAEMSAIYKAVYHGVCEFLIHQGDHLLIQSDCLGAMDRLEGRAVSNTPQGFIILGYWNRIVEQGRLNVVFRHVKAHSGIQDKRSTANRMCDLRAKQYMRVARKRKIAQSEALPATSTGKEETA